MTIISAGGSSVFEEYISSGGYEVEVLGVMSLSGLQHLGYEVVIR